MKSVRVDNFAPHRHNLTHWTDNGHTSYHNISTAAVTQKHFIAQTGKKNNSHEIHLRNLVAHSYIQYCGLAHNHQTCTFMLSWIKTQWTQTVNECCNMHIPHCICGPNHAYTVTMVPTCTSSLGNDRAGQCWGAEVPKEKGRKKLKRKGKKCWKEGRDYVFPCGCMLYKLKFQPSSSASWENVIKHQQWGNNQVN